MKCLLLTDKPNWAYHSIAQSLVKYNTDDSVRLSVMHIKSNERKIKAKYKKYDRVLIMGWQTYERVKFIDKSKALIGIHSHHSWDHRKTQPDKNVSPPRKLIKFLSQFRGVNTVSIRLYNLFKKHGLTNLYYTPNGVDTQLFTCDNHVMSNQFTIGYSGSKPHDWRKGITKFIVPSAQQSNVKVKLAMSNSDSLILLKEMPLFYSKIDCYVCASSSEGFSLSVLEAASCGRPIISTRVGGTDELIKDRVNGFLVDRTVKDITKHINMLKSDPDLFEKISRNIRQDVVDHHGWEKACVNWIEFFKNT